MILPFMGSLLLIQFAFFLSYHYRQLWWPISIPALSNGFFQFFRPCWYSQPSSTQPKSWWVRWLKLKKQMLNKHAVGKWNKRTFLFTGIMSKSSVEKKKGKGGYNGIKPCFLVHNGYSKYACSCLPNSIEASSVQKRCPSPLLIDSPEAVTQVCAYSWCTINVYWLIDIFTHEHFWRPHLLEF